MAQEMNKNCLEISGDDAYLTCLYEIDKKESEKLDEAVKMFKNLRRKMINDLMNWGLSGHNFYAIVWLLVEKK